jgi:hypothetical protein
MCRERSSDFVIAEQSRTQAVCVPRRNGSETLLGVSAMLLEVKRHHPLDARALIGIDVTAGEKVLRQWPRSVARPGLKPRHELRLVDQAVLQRQNAEQQVARWVCAAVHRDCLQSAKTLPRESDYNGLDALMLRMAGENGKLRRPQTHAQLVSAKETRSARLARTPAFLCVRSGAAFRAGAVVGRGA